MNSRIEFITKHFLVISAAISAVGAAISVVFVSGYLSAFDKSAIWVIEYQDLIKFTLIGIGSFAVFSSVFVGFVSELVDIFTEQNKLNRIVFLLIIVTIFMISGVSAFLSYRSGDYDRVLFDILYFFSGFCLIFLIFMTALNVNNLKNKRHVPLYLTVLNASVALGVVFFIGLTIGHSVKSNKEYRYEITTKDKSNSESIFNKVKIVMILSHHAILLMEDKTIIIPSADIVRISSARK